MQNEEIFSFGVDPSEESLDPFLMMENTGEQCLNQPASTPKGN
jgi:hypothetical protein